MKKILFSLLAVVFVFSMFNVTKTSAAGNYMSAEFYVDGYNNSENGLQAFIINRGNRTLYIKSMDVKIFDANDNVMLDKNYNFGEITLQPGGYHKFNLNAPELIDRQYEMVRHETIINHTLGLLPINKSGTFVYVNGKKISPDVPPAIVNNRVLVPMRSIFEALGATVSWDSATNVITAYKENIDVTLTHKIGQNYMMVNGEKIVIDVSSQSIKGRTMVPVRAIASAFYVDIEYVQQDKVNYITVMDIFALSEK